MTLLSAYTFGKVIDTASDTEDLPLTSHDLRMERAVARFDVAHTWTMSWTWQLPGASKWLGGWQLSGILLARTGLPFSVMQSQNLLSTGTQNRPDRLASGVLADPTADRWFDVAAFRPTADNTGTYGNSGRDILRGPGQLQADLSLVKNTRLRENLTHQFKFELFNALNHPQFAQPASTVGSASAGVISSLLFNTPMRQIQLAMKLIF